MFIYLQFVPPPLDILCQNANKYISRSKTPVSCHTPATTSRGGLGGRAGIGAAASLSEQILQVRIDNNTGGIKM